MSENNSTELKDLLTQTKITNKLLVIQIKMKGDIPQQELIGQLSSTGAAPKEIAELLNTSPGTVNVALSRLRKGKSKKAKKNEQEA